MVVGVAGVAGDDAAACFLCGGLLIGVLLLVVLEVAGCEGDDAANVGQDLGGIEAFFLVSF